MQQYKSNPNLNTNLPISSLPPGQGVLAAQAQEMYEEIRMRLTRMAQLGAERQEVQQLHNEASLGHMLGAHFTLGAVMHAGTHAGGLNATRL